MNEVFHKTTAQADLGPLDAFKISPIFFDAKAHLNIH